LGARIGELSVLVKEVGVNGVFKRKMCPSHGIFHP